MSTKWTGAPGIVLLNAELRKLSVRMTRIDVLQRLRRAGTVATALLAQVKQEKRRGQ